MATVPGRACRKDVSRRRVNTVRVKMASVKKKGSGVEKGVNGRRSSKHKEGPVGKLQSDTGLHRRIALVIIVSASKALNIACDSMELSYAAS